MRNVLLALVLCFSVAACNMHPGSVVISKSELLNKQLSKSTIYYFDPEVTIYEVSEMANQDILLAAELSEYVKVGIKKASKSHGFSVRFFSDEKSDHYYQMYINQLMLLKTEVEQVAVLQDNPLNKSPMYALEFKQNVFVYPPRISPEYAQLSQVLNSPYISLCGFFSVKSHPKNPETKSFVRNHPDVNYGNYSYFYHIIVNVETAQIEYREIKYIPAIARKQYIDPVIYDSFAMLKNNLK